MAKKLTQSESHQCENLFFAYDLTCPNRGCNWSVTTDETICEVLYDELTSVNLTCFNNLPHKLR
jgi:hypothetical protein